MCVCFSSVHDFSRIFFRFRQQEKYSLEFVFTGKGCRSSIFYSKLPQGLKLCHNWRPTWGYVCRVTPLRSWVTKTPLPDETEDGRDEVLARGSADLKNPLESTQSTGAENHPERLKTAGSRQRGRTPPTQLKTASLLSTSQQGLKTTEKAAENCEDFVKEKRSRNVLTSTNIAIAENVGDRSTSLKTLEIKKSLNQG